MPFEFKPDTKVSSDTALTSEILRMNLCDILLVPILDLTRDKYLRDKFEAPLALILKDVSQLDLESLEDVWGIARSGVEPERESLEGRLTHRCGLTLGSSTEFPPFRSVWAFALLKEAALSLKADGLLAPFSPEEPDPDEPVVEEQEIPLLLHWRVARDNPNALEAEFDGVLLDPDCHEDQDETNKLFWFTIIHTPSHGFTVSVERRIYLDPERTRHDRKVIAQQLVREINRPGDENSRDRPITREFGKQLTEEEYYSITQTLWLLAWELATNTIETFQGLRKGIYVNSPYYLSDPTNYRKTGPGPYPFLPEMAWGVDGYTPVYKDRTVDAIGGVLVHGEPVRFIGGIT